MDTNFGFILYQEKEETNIHHLIFMLSIMAEKGNSASLTAIKGTLVICTMDV
jgi:hypothetical protein